MMAEHFDGTISHVIRHMALYKLLNMIKFLANPVNIAYIPAQSSTANHSNNI